MTKRFINAYEIWNVGASNHMGVTNALLDAMKEVRGEGGDISQDPAVKMILDHLCFLCNMPQPSFIMENWERVYKAVEDQAK